MYIMAYLLDMINPTTYTHPSIHTYIQSEKKARHGIPLGYDKPDKIHTYIHTYIHARTYIQSEKKARHGIPLGYYEPNYIHTYIHTV